MKNSLKFLISVLLIVIFVFAIAPKEFQNDTLYLIALGEQIKSSGVDGIDHFSWHSGLKYTYPHWAFDIICSSINNWAGFTGLYIFTCLCSSIFMLLIFWYLLKNDINWLVALISTLLITFLTKDGFICRGQLISYPMFFLELLCIDKFIKKPNILSVIGTFIISCIIANVHATAWIFTLVLFLPVIAEYIVYCYTLVGINERLNKRYSKKLALAEKKGDKDLIKKYKEELKHQEEFQKTYKPTDSRIIIRKNENVKWIWILFLVAILGALCTPLKDIPFTYYLRSSVGTTLSVINEHLPIIPANDLSFFVFSASFILLFLFTKEKFELKDMFLLAGLYIMTLSARRNMILLSFICSPIIVKTVDSFIKENTSHNTEIDINSINKASNVFFGIISVIVIGVSIFFFVVKTKIDYLSEDFYPIKATEFIKKNIDYKKSKIYNDYDYGSYLMYKKVPVLIDSRSDLYTSPFNKGVKIFDDYIDAKYGKKSISELLDKYGIEYVLTNKKELIYTYIKEDNRFEKIYSDKYFVIYQYEAE